MAGMEEQRILQILMSNSFATGTFSSDELEISGSRENTKIREYYLYGGS